MEHITNNIIDYTQFNINNLVIGEIEKHSDEEKYYSYKIQYNYSQSDGTVVLDRLRVRGPPCISSIRKKIIMDTDCYASYVTTSHSQFLAVIEQIYDKFKKFHSLIKASKSGQQWEDCKHPIRYKDGMGEIRFKVIVDGKGPTTFYHDNKLVGIDDVVNKFIDGCPVIEFNDWVNIGSISLIRMYLHSHTFQNSIDGISLKSKDIQSSTVYSYSDILYNATIAATVAIHVLGISYIMYRVTKNN